MHCSASEGIELQLGTARILEIFAGMVRESPGKGIPMTDVQDEVDSSQAEIDERLHPGFLRARSCAGRH
jgi:hypothetical protein